MHRHTAFWSTAQRASGPLLKKTRTSAQTDAASSQPTRPSGIFVEQTVEVVSVAS